MFRELLMSLTPRLTKANTNCRKALEPGLKLAMTLRFLATGNSFHDLAYAFLLPHNTTFLTEVLVLITLGGEISRLSVVYQIA